MKYSRRSRDRSAGAFTWKLGRRGGIDMRRRCYKFESLAITAYRVYLITLSLDITLILRPGCFDTAASSSNDQLGRSGATTKPFKVNFQPLLNMSSTSIPDPVRHTTEKSDLIALLAKNTEELMIIHKILIF